MEHVNDLTRSWNSLPRGVRVAFQEQWAALSAGGLPCGAAVVAADGTVIASGRNWAYDPAGDAESRVRSPLQHTRLAHAELNALGDISTETDHAALTLWTTQHRCAMCAAAVAFVGIGAVGFVADDPSDHSSPEQIIVRRGGVRYHALGNPLWWTISNVLFLYNSAVCEADRARNLSENRDRYPH